MILQSQSKEDQQMTSEQLFMELNTVSYEISKAAVDRDFDRVASLDRECRTMIVKLAKVTTQTPDAMPVLTQALNSVKFAASELVGLRSDLAAARARERKVRAAYHPHAASI